MVAGRRHPVEQEGAEAGPFGVRSSAFTRRSSADARRRTRPRDSSRSTSLVTFDASQASVSASWPIRDRPARLDEVQHVTLSRRELKLRGKRRQFCALRRTAASEDARRHRHGGSGLHDPASIVHSING